MSALPKCQGTTKKGNRCNKNAELNSEFCWRHQVSSNINNQLVNLSLYDPNISDLITDYAVTEPFFDVNRFNEIRSEVDRGNLKNISDIIASGPLTLNFSVGNYELLILEFDLKLSATDYTFQDIINTRKNFYQQTATRKNLLDLIDIGKNKVDFGTANKDILEIYLVLLERMDKGEDIKLLDLDLTNRGVWFDANINEYWFDANVNKYQYPELVIIMD